MDEPDIHKSQLAVCWMLRLAPSTGGASETTMVANFLRSAALDFEILLSASRVAVGRCGKM